jgi:hypothetical protein
MNKIEKIHGFICNAFASLFLLAGASLLSISALFASAAFVKVYFQLITG